MALKVAMGQYYPGSSVLHRLDPRAKLVGSLVCMVGALFIGNAAQLALATVLTLAFVALSRVPLGKVLESASTLIAFLVVIGLFNLFVVQTGTELVHVWIVRITTDGVWAAALYSWRFALLLLVGLVLLLTTTPTQLADAFESLLSPLAGLGVPVHELAMVLSLALRFVPTLANEANQVMDAQAARGGSLETGTPAQRVRGLVSVAVPLFAGAIRHADTVSKALDARGFEGGARRSHWHPMRMQLRDGIFLACSAAYVAALVALGILL